ncbi:matrix protein [Trichinella spiralis]|uniref:Matrix protein n=1 Tax=Trichinella spiralis TaxID=6334 RepID=A0ABR3KMG1_TRISP
MEVSVTRLRFFTFFHSQTQLKISWKILKKENKFVEVLCHNTVYLAEFTPKLIENVKEQHRNFPKHFEKRTGQKVMTELPPSPLLTT